MEWIDVNESTPEAVDDMGYSEAVLASHGDGTIDFSYYGHEEKTWIRLDDGTDSNDVIGWMKLPEPYVRK